MFFVKFVLHCVTPASGLVITVYVTLLLPCNGNILVVVGLILEASGILSPLKSQLNKKYAKL